VLNDNTGRRVGTEAGSGLISRVGAAGAQIFLSIAIHLPGGNITAGATSSTAPHKSHVVTGGTGSYLRARCPRHLV
jgi:hypothetical protein